MFSEALRLHELLHHFLDFRLFRLDFSQHPRLHEFINQREQIFARERIIVSRRYFRKKLHWQPFVLKVNVFEAPEALDDVALVLFQNSQKCLGEFMVVILYPRYQFVGLFGGHSAHLEDSLKAPDVCAHMIVGLKAVLIPTDYATAKP